MVRWYQESSRLDQGFCLDGLMLPEEGPEKRGRIVRTGRTTRCRGHQRSRWGCRWLWGCVLDTCHSPAACFMPTAADPLGGNGFCWTWLIPAIFEPITPRWTTSQPLNIFSDCLIWYFGSQTHPPLFPAINRSLFLRFCLFCVTYLVWNTIYILSQGTTVLLN